MEAEKILTHVRWLLICLIMFFCSLCFLIPQKAGGANDADSFQIPATLTLSGAIDLALQKNAAVHSAQRGVIASEFGKKSAKTQFFPSLSATALFSRWDEAPARAGVPLSEKEDYRMGLAIEQPLYTGGALTNTYKIASLGLEDAKYQYQEKSQEIMFQARAQYLSLLTATKAKGVTEQEVQQLEAHIKTAQILYNGGVILKADLLKVTVQLANTHQRLTKAENSVELARSNLNSLLGLKLETEYQLEEALNYTPYSADLQACFKKALDLRPELRKVKADFKQANLSINLAKSDYYPKFSLVGNLDWAKEAFSWDAEVSFRLTAQMSWPFWEWRKTEYKVAEAKARANQAADAVKLLEDAVCLEVKQAFLKLEEAQKNIFVSQKAIEQAEENYRINQEGFKENAVTSTDLLDAEILLAQTRLNHYTSLFDYNLAQAALEKAIGIIGYSKTNNHLVNYKEEK